MFDLILNAPCTLCTPLYTLSKYLLKSNKNYRITDISNNKGKNNPFNVLNVFKVDNKNTRTTNIVLGPLNQCSILINCFYY